MHEIIKSVKDIKAGYKSTAWEITQYKYYVMRMMQYYSQKMKMISRGYLLNKFVITTSIFNMSISIEKTQTMVIANQI